MLRPTVSYPAKGLEMRAVGLFWIFFTKVETTNSIQSVAEDEIGSLGGKTAGTNR